jgi:preprotein translocase subunit SecA
MYMAVLEGRHVHVATPNDYCAQRDSTAAGRVLSAFGVDIGYLGGPETETGNRPACGHQVTYGTPQDFALRCLRRQMETSQQPLPDACCDVVIMDEIDWMLIDRGVTSVWIVEGTVPVDEPMIRRADAVARELIAKAGADPLYRFHVDKGGVEVTPAGLAALHDGDLAPDLAYSEG